MLTRIFTLLLLSAICIVQAKAQCPSIISISYEEINCNGTSDGAITITATGGTSPYQYSIDNGMTFQSNNYFGNLSARCDTVVVMDVLNCTTKEDYCLVEPGLLSILGYVDSYPVCAGGSDGAATVTGSGGIVPYIYQWSNGWNYATAVNLGAGIYTATVTDFVGCTATTSIEIIEPLPIETVITVEDVFCNGVDNGSITASVTGGTISTPDQYYYYLSGVNSFDSTFTGLAAGIYDLIVTDENGCTDSVNNIMVGSNTFPSPDVSLTVINESCLGGNGSITSSISNGNPPFSYFWSTGATTANIDQLAGGQYFLTVFDVNSCYLVFDTLVASFLDVDIATTLSTCDQADGTATVTVNGSTGATFAWSDGQTGSIATGLATGWYSVTVDDAGCGTHRNVFVDEDPDCTVVLDGFVVNDEVSNDCMTGTTSVPMANKLIHARSGTAWVASTYTDSMGYYSFELDYGTYELELELTTSDSMLCTSNFLTVNAPDVTQTYSNNFYLAFRVINDLKINVITLVARPGFSHWEDIIFCNNGNLPADGMITYEHDSIFVNFVGSTIADTYDYINDVATWNFTNLLPGECRTIRANFALPPSVSSGTVYRSDVYIEPTASDATPSDNTSWVQLIVTGSYDPNDKQNLSARDSYGGDIHPDVEAYNYLVRFQNTGTDTAFTVVIKDEIDENLDLASLRPISASHNFSMDVEGQNTVVFFFENILLPDSIVNEPKSHGFVYFTINRKLNLPLGTEIKNDAAIYFDFNIPVITNEVVNTLAFPMAIIRNTPTNFDFSIFPNPTSKTTSINLALQQDLRLDIDVLDVQGRLLASVQKGKAFVAGDHLIPLDVVLPAGVYFVQIKSENGVMSRRLVVL